MDLECSENINLKATKPGLGSEANRASPEETGRPEDKESHDLKECEKWELELSWLQRCADYASRLNTTIKAKEHQHMMFDFSGLEPAVQQRKRMISEEVSRLLQSPSPLVRQAAFSVVSRVISRRFNDYADVEPVESETMLKALLDGCKLSGRLDIELTMRECLLRAMDTRDVVPEDMIDAIRHYIEACKSYMMRIKQLEYLETYVYIDPCEVSFPFNGDARISGLLMRHFPTFSLEGLDIWGNNTLQALIWTADQEDIEQLIPTMDSGDFLSVATKRGPCGYTILHIASIRNISCVIEKASILSRVDINSTIHITDESSWTPLLHAVARGYCGIVRTLLELGADPKAQDNQKRNALHYAAGCGQKDTTRLLLSHYPSLCTATDWHGYTPFHAAINHGHLEVAKMFASTSGTVLLVDEGTPLHIASMKGHVPLISWLLDERDAGTIDWKDAFGRTPLSLAARSGNLDAVNLLLSRGADFTIADENGNTPCEVARIYGYHDIVSVLERVSIPAHGQ
ncbi:hypothetical protein PFICI_05806 [Pestalotiopsis fici W106-1]|uniref:Uncharacterized protein n=1 Tax=Pestalotiopsis fici (strain W106-1 / CGMCC3.15140) TaxID=1229662 RepID=W3XCZ3_PESFW|nr:uncharacterized protein PFICI_05806 [Pestalotiopsis fici W106-1]ETS83930.1 hypothetical protein PFICI_05806 [Pestalotiopsis fici W106-1]